MKKLPSRPAVGFAKGLPHPYGRGLLAHIKKGGILRQRTRKGVSENAALRLIRRWGYPKTTDRSP